jgi:hypothetical protein
VRSLTQSERRRQGQPWTLRLIPAGEVAVTVRIALCLAGIQENHEYPRQFANYLGNPGLYEKSFKWENSI